MELIKLSNTLIPRPVIAVAAEILSEKYTHAQLDNMFVRENAPGDPPIGSKLVKCQEWLSLCSADENIDGMNVLGGLVADFMEREFPETPAWDSTPTWVEEWIKQRDYFTKVLASQGLAYFRGGYIRKFGEVGPTKTLEQILTSRDLEGVNQEFNRALESIEADPPASLTAACAIVESLCKIYIADNGLDFPKDQSLKPLWNIVRSHLGFDPSRIEDDDLKKILSGLNSIVDGLGAIRTHAGSAHGRGRICYRIEPRHARLAVHAAHTIVTFVIETWDHKNS